MSSPRVRVSMSEVNRVAPWSLRALGYSFGTAERATRLLVWTEAATGGGLSILSAGADAIRAANVGPAPDRTRDDDGNHLILARGRCLLDVGPVLVDLATAGARQRGIGAAAATGVMGVRLAAALSDLGVRRGLHIMVVFAADPQDYGPDAAQAAGCILGNPGPDGPDFLSWRLPDSSAAPDLAAMLAPGELVRGAVVRSHLERATEAAAEGIGRVCVIGSETPFGRPTGAIRQDWAGRVVEAYRRGIEVARDDLDHLYRLEKLTWAPTSERSRKQAGF